VVKRASDANGVSDRLSRTTSRCRDKGIISKTEFPEKILFVDSIQNQVSQVNKKELRERYG